MPGSTRSTGRRLRALAVAAAMIVLLLALAAAGGYFWLQNQFQAAGPAAAPSRIEVDPGASVRSVLGRLEARGAVRNARAVEAYLRLRGREPRVQAGTYEIPPHASPDEIITLFEQGKVVIMAALGHPGVHAEGQFFPDTYRFAANTPDVAILGLAYDSMQRMLAAAWAQRSAQLPFDTPYQALILASMVEKEAALKSERARIAGVFVNRLRKRMRLQSDPMVIYGLGEKYDGSIHTRDLLKDTPYNTYTREGLPPTPVALPGRESVLAAVQPEPTDALYFVATGLGDGAHHFSRSLEEHNSAVKAYLARLRTQERAAVHKPVAVHP